MSSDVFAFMVFLRFWIEIVHRSTVGLAAAEKASTLDASAESLVGQKCEETVELPCDCGDPPAQWLVRTTARSYARCGIHLTL